jgi:hypothetical protein
VLPPSAGAISAYCGPEMAARRLLIIMVVLLVLSSVAAALVPPPTERSQPEEEQAPTTTTGRASGGSQRVRQLLAARVEAEARRPARITAHVGDQLALTVEAEAYREVEVPAFGLLEPAEPGAPATFDILVDRPGSFLVRLAASGRAIARIEVRESERISRSARSGGSRAGGPGSPGERER